MMVHPISSKSIEKFAEKQTQECLQFHKAVALNDSH